MFPSGIRSGCALLSFVDNVVYGRYKIPLDFLKADAPLWTEKKIENELLKLVGHPFTYREMQRKVIYTL